MQNKLVFLLIFIFTLIIPTSVGQADQAPINRQLTASSLESRQLDKRAVILSAYFAKYNSPFQYHAGDFIDAADTYGVDWKLVPAISGVESTFGKHSYGYNAWGWGIYGDQRLNFSSWRKGIFTVTGGLKENYIDDGLTDPYSMNKRYAASKTWGSRVDYFMKDISKFEAEYEAHYTPDKPVELSKTAGSSAQIVLE
jgi:hypothetical protein